MVRLASCLIKGTGTLINAESGVQWAHKAAMIGHPGGLCMLAEFYATGSQSEHGIPLDISKAEEYYLFVPVLHCCMIPLPLNTMHDVEKACYEWP
jgi:TPR repeat protein